MPYADTDFFVALLDKDDRLNKAARAAYERFRGTIYTSLAVAIEFVLVGVRHGIKAQQLLNDLTAIGPIKGVDRLQLLQVGKYIDEFGVGVFDAFHAVLCDNAIISSDKIYDGLGIRRIELVA